MYDQLKRCSRGLLAAQLKRSSTTLPRIVAHVRAACEPDTDPLTHFEVAFFQAPSTPGAPAARSARRVSKIEEIVTLSYRG